ncbi:hypothetical protein GCM10022206_60160 [Streptomyces chiangmaiensis]
MRLQNRLHLAGQAGARLAAAVGITVSKETPCCRGSVPCSDVGDMDVPGVPLFSFVKGRRVFLSRLDGLGD